MMKWVARRVDVCWTHRRFYEALKSFRSLGKTGGFRRAALLRLGKQEGWKIKKTEGQTEIRNSPGPQNQPQNQHACIDPLRSSVRRCRKPPIKLGLIPMPPTSEVPLSKTPNSRHSSSQGPRD